MQWHYFRIEFTGLSYALQLKEQPPVNEAAVEAIIKEGAIDVDAPATSEATVKPAENTTTTAFSELEAATVSEAPQWPAWSSLNRNSFWKPSSEVTSTASSGASNYETAFWSKSNKYTYKQRKPHHNFSWANNLAASQKMVISPSLLKREGITKKAR